MLKDITRQIKINSFLSEEIIIERGVNQGDPLSTLLYIIVAEVLGNQIRSNQNIKGVSINGTEEKLFQYADDTNPIMSDDNSLNELFNPIRTGGFHQARGLLPITLEVINVHSRNLMTFPKI